MVVILSDGLDRGEPDALLAEAMRAIQRRARQRDLAEPAAAATRATSPRPGGMRAALPFVDHFAPAHDLESLERLLPHLVA